MKTVKLFFEKIKRAVVLARYAESVNLRTVTWTVEPSPTIGGEPVSTQEARFGVVITFTRYRRHEVVDKLSLRFDTTDGGFTFDSGGYTVCTTGIPFYGLNVGNMTLEPKNTMVCYVNGHKYINERIKAVNKTLVID